MLACHLGECGWGAIIVRNPISWLISQFTPAANKAASAVTRRFVCGTPHVWAEEQQEAADWALADKEQSYDGKFYSGDDAKRVMAAWRDGLGVPKDYVQAHKWFNLAASRGTPMGRKNREEIAAKMTPAQITEAQNLAREWKPIK